MFEHVGLAKVGLPSNESPVSVSDGSTSYNHLGIMQLGVKSLIPRSYIHAVRGKLMRDIRIVLSSSGTISVNVVNRHRSVGAMFIPLFKLGHCVKGNISLPHIATLETKGTIRQAYTSLIASEGTLAYGSHHFHAVTAICKANFSTLLPQSGILQQSYAHSIPSNGFLLANYSNTMRLEGILRQEESFYVQHIGTSATLNVNLILIKAGTDLGLSNPF